MDRCRDQYRSATQTLRAHRHEAVLGVHDRIRLLRRRLRTGAERGDGVERVECALLHRCLVLHRRRTDPAVPQRSGRRQGGLPSGAYGPGPSGSPRPRSRSGPSCSTRARPARCMHGASPLRRSSSGIRTRADPSPSSSAGVLAVVAYAHAPQTLGAGSSCLVVGLHQSGRMHRVRRLGGGCVHPPERRRLSTAASRTRARSSVRSASCWPPSSSSRSGIAPAVTRTGRSPARTTSPFCNERRTNAGGAEGRDADAGRGIARSPRETGGRAAVDSSWPPVSCGRPARGPSPTRTRRRVPSRSPSGRSRSRAAPSSRSSSSGGASFPSTGGAPSASSQRSRVPSPLPSGSRPRACVLIETVEPDVRAADGVSYWWLDLVALSAAYATIALLGWIGVATILDHSFVGAMVFASPAVVLGRLVDCAQRLSRLRERDEPHPAPSVAGAGRSSSSSAS